MSGDVPVRKDGRPLYFDHPVRPEEFIEIIDGPIPKGAITCGLRRTGREHEAWMDDI